MKKLMLIAVFILTLFSTNAELAIHSERSLRRLFPRECEQGTTRRTPAVVDLHQQRTRTPLADQRRLNDATGVWHRCRWMEA